MAKKLREDMDLALWYEVATLRKRHLIFLTLTVMGLHPYFAE